VKVAFWGTPDIAVTVLDALTASTRHEVGCVVTMPDRPAGRRREPAPSPVKRRAEATGLPVLQPARPADVLGRPELDGCDAFVVAAYGGLLPPTVLDVAPHGCINVHPSLLPRWRGAAPVERALLARDAVTGVCIMRMDEGLDTGPVLARVEVPVPDGVTAGALLDHLAGVGAALLVDTLDAIDDGTATAVAQTDDGITYADKLTSADCRIDWSASAADVDAMVRAANPRPGAWTERIDPARPGTRLKIWRCTPRTDVAAGSASAPGTVVVHDRRPFAVCGDGVLELVEVQPDGARRMDGRAFVAGCRDGLPVCR
jgi:methionyl-tRNA formyltransferase